MSRSYLRSVPRQSSLADAISTAYGEIESLAEEMGEWRDNMEEKLSHTSKFDQVSECADTLDNYREEPDYDPSVIGDLTVSFGETENKSKKRGISRATRLDNALNRLNAATEALNAAIDEIDSDEEAAETEGVEDRKSALEELRDALQDTIDNLDGNVEFPGMFG